MCSLYGEALTTAFDAQSPAFIQRCVRYRGDVPRSSTATHHKRTLARLPHRPARAYARPPPHPGRHCSVGTGSRPPRLHALLGRRAPQLRFGSGGVILPHHAALSIAEQVSLPEAPSGDSMAKARRGSRAGGTASSSRTQARNAPSPWTSRPRPARKCPCRRGCPGRRESRPGPPSVP